MDVAMNTHATATERAWGAAIMSSFHGFFSLGGLLGAGAGAALIGGGASVAGALLAGGAGAGIPTLAALRSLRLAFEAAEGGHGFAWPRRAVLGIGILTFLAMVMEGAVADWSGVLPPRRDRRFAAVRPGGLRGLLARDDALPLRRRRGGAPARAHPHLVLGGLSPRSASPSPSGRRPRS